MSTTSDQHVTMEKLLSLSKRRGFLFQSSEIYGGLNATWDYGPLGAELKRNVKDAWWRSMVQHRDDTVGFDSAILMHPSTWQASGHLETSATLWWSAAPATGDFAMTTSTQRTAPAAATNYLTRANST